MAAIEQREFWLRLGNHQKRLVRTWWPVAAEPHSIMCIVPGLGEHSGRYTALAARLVAAGSGIIAIDLQGHGLSPGWRGCVDSYESLLEEVQALIHFARGGSELQHLAAGESIERDRTVDLATWPIEKRIPVCLYGHSMGGNLVLNAVLRKLAEPDRVIASAPMLRAVHPPSPAVVRLARIFMHVVPHYRLRAPVRKEYLSHVEAEREAYAADPLVHGCVSIRLGAGLIDSGVWALENANLLDRPCLIIHGSEDRITDMRASQAFAAAAVASGAACHFICYPGMLHDLHRDEGRERVIADIIDWLG